MRRRYDRRRAGVVAKAATVGAAPSSSSQNAPANASSDTAAPTRRLSSQMKLHVHGPEFQNGDELVLNPEFFPELKELSSDKYVVEIFHATESQRVREESAVASAAPFTDAEYVAAQHHLLLEVPPSSATPIRGNLKVSVFKDTAAAFQLAPFNDVTLRFVEKTRVQVEFVEISLKDQFLSRRDLWYLKQSLVGMALYVGKNVRVQGTRWQVMDLRAGDGEVVRSGVVSTTTKFAFRSRTSRVMWLVQMSPEMWEMANSGKLYLEILLQVVQNVLRKWIKHNVSHSLTIILFARNYYPELDTRDRNVGYGSLSTPPRSSYYNTKNRVLHHGSSAGSRRSRVESMAAESAFPFSGKTDDMFAIGVDEDGRHYQDFYKIVAFDSAVVDAQPLLVQLKEEMNAFPHLCGWRSPRSPPTPGSAGLPGEEPPLPGALPSRRHGVPSPARDGNLLEAINIVLNIFEKHHIDRHLARSGQSVVLITAGNGIFRVKKRLAEITEQRMMDHGIGIDMISLSTPPLHKCPLFVFKQSDMAEFTLPSRGDGLAGITGTIDGCTCNNASMPTNARASSTQARRSRTGSSDLSAGAELPQMAEISLRGGHQQQQQAQAPSSSTHGGLVPPCKTCQARLAARKRHEVPLWIPLSFVQERMMVDHQCPLDNDMTSSCSVCCPFRRSKNRAFEPLPMCRMFDDVTAWQEPPRSSVSVHARLPKPLERLLNNFKESKPSNDENGVSRDNEADDDDDDVLGFSHIRGFNSTGQFDSFLLDNDYLSLGRDSELVRARAPSLESLADDCDDMNCGSRQGSSGRISRDPVTDADRFRECDSYDDAVFSKPVAKGVASKNMMKSGGGDDMFHTGRLCLTPPLKSRATMTKKVSARSSSNIFQNAGYTGGGEDTLLQSQRQLVTSNNYNSNTHGETNRWRSPLHTAAMPTSSPGAPPRGSVQSDGKIYPTTADSLRSSGIGDGDGEEGCDQGDDDSSVDLSLPRGRTLGGSLPNTFQLLTAGDSGTYANSPILMPSSEVKSQDDLFHTDAYMYKQLTSNQRRWSQVRPNDGKNPYRRVQSVLKWKSLCFPALLPLTTDFIPRTHELKMHYNEYPYSVTLPERDEQSGVTFRDYKELVMEMVAQRFSQDFQLVATEAPKFSSTSKSRSVLFRLTMGHRIHEIRYNEGEQTVDVKRYQQRATAASDVNIMEYRYSMWSPVTQSFLFATQQFRKYPRQEYSWNHLDQLICGYNDDMYEGIRYKRILFCIMPPQLQGGSENEKDDTATVKLFAEKCQKWVDFLKSKADPGAAASFPSIQIASEWCSGDSHRSGVEAFKRVGQENVKVVLHAPDSPTSQNWLIMRLDTELFPTQCFHIEVQWLVCRSALVEEFIQGLVRRSKQLGLDFVQVSENGISKDLDIHPLICPIFMPLRDPSAQRIVEAALVDQLNFCCEAFHEIPTVHLNHADEYKILDVSATQSVRERRKIRYYRQYVHRSFACFVRVTQTGFVWISNQKLQCPDTQPIYEALRELVESVQTVQEVLKDVMSDVMVLVEEAMAQRVARELIAQEAEEGKQVVEEVEVVEEEEEVTGAVDSVGVMDEQQHAEQQEVEAGASDGEKENVDAANNRVEEDTADPAAPTEDAAAVAAVAAIPIAKQPPAAAAVTSTIHRHENDAPTTRGSSSMVV